MCDNFYLKKEKKYPFRMTPPFFQSNHNRQMYLMLLTSVIIMQLGLANERLGQETNGLSECDNSIIQINITCRKEKAYIPNARNTLQNDSLIEKEAKNTTLTEHFQKTGQNNPKSVLASSTLNENKTCNFIDDGQAGNVVEKCNDVSGHASNSSGDSFPFENVLYEIMVSVGLFLVGGTVMLLNLVVIVVMYLTPKLRRNTYLNLVLSLSVTDCLFGFSTLFNGFRKSLGNILGNGDICFISILITSSPLAVSLYQTFLIGFHRYLVITGSAWGKKLFKNRRKYIWYIIGWSMVIVPLSFFYKTLSTEIDAECSINKETQARYITVCIVIVPEIVYMVLVVVFYCLAMCSLKRRYLNSSPSNVSTSILNNKRQKYLKSMKSVSILLAVLLIFSGPLLVYNVVDLVQPVPKLVLYLTFALANINSLLNPLIYFINIAEFKTALKRLFSRTQSSESSTASTM